MDVIHSTARTYVVIVGNGKWPFERIKDMSWLWNNNGQVEEKKVD